ncbi:LysR family transcriptional regulator [Pseudomonas sp. RIT288]|jgi:DNA-binding transcriptional LysR family regulator|uniref:LysR family transcriptional regulator n=1 Tax=Pseudomonas sp. RIT288 TaxID=1470589 RepID=UPI000450C57F|nr:LysR family transcriptional regulator [Pseudomonas sp. RIT288]EZP30733.1 LysR family transcriptional regulator [Pseudomonas sp. RIT288]
MARYTELHSFIQIAQKGSFAAAAISEGVTPAMLGRRLDSLEKRLGVKLMHRSTRGLRLTELGEQLLERARSLIREFDDIEADISSSAKRVTGNLLLSAPAGFGRLHVAPHALAFHRQFPHLKLSFNLTDSLVDLVGEGYDMSIRIGPVTDPNYVAIKLFSNRRVVCGTPAYFEEHGTPTTLEQLAEHNCLAFTSQGGQQRGWTFQQDGKPVAVRVGGNLACNDGELLFAWMRQGVGIGWRSTWEIRKELLSGELVTVLDDFALPDYDIQAVYPQQRYLPAKVRHFIDYLKAVYQQPGYW